MIEQLDDDVRMTETPARHAHLYVLGSRTIPSVLLEVGFLSNRQDESLLRQAAHRHVLVQAISDAIDDYFAAFRDPSCGAGLIVCMVGKAVTDAPRREEKLMRQMTLVAFLQAQNCTNFVGSWRHPEASPDFMTADYYRHIARVLEAGKFHVGFFDDRLAMPDRFGGDHAHTVANGIRCVKMDPITILTVMGMATERLGLGSTCSTTYYEPFHVARVFQTLDLMTNGRAAWNIVTSMNDGEALNMGHAAHGDHDLRYDRADEFLEVVIGHWDSWDDDAIVVDKRTGTSRIPTRCVVSIIRRILPFARTVHRRPWPTSGTRSRPALPPSWPARSGRRATQVAGHVNRGQPRRNTSESGADVPTGKPNAATTMVPTHRATIAPGMRLDTRLATRMIASAPAERAVAAGDHVQKREARSCTRGMKALGTRSTLSPNRSRTCVLAISTAIYGQHDNDRARDESHGRCPSR